MLDPSEVRLMEVPARLADVLTEGQTLVIRGDGEDSAVIWCGTPKTCLARFENKKYFILLCETL
jgi:hypothetical protein